MPTSDAALPGPAGAPPLPAADPEARYQDGSTLLLGARDVFESLALVRARGLRPAAAILDPWYNKGFGGVRADYDDFIGRLLAEACALAEHVFLWGFPEIIGRYLGSIPPGCELVAWLTWYYKNNPSVIRGWRSSQSACLHLARTGARLHPEHFLNRVQESRRKAGRLRYLPGPTSVIEAPLLVGFVGRDEQTGHPSQKPLAVYDKIIRMATEEGDLVFDPMAGSGTAGVVCRLRNRRCLLGDLEPAYVELAAARLERLAGDPALAARLVRRLDAATNNPDRPAVSRRRPGDRPGGGRTRVPGSPGTPPPG